MKILFSILLVFFNLIIMGQSLSNVSPNPYVYNNEIKKDSMHSSMILEVRYESDTLYVKARHYAICCERFVSYIEKKENLSQINFVVKSIENGCLCESEKIITHKVLAKNLARDVQLRINGEKPKFGVHEYLSPVIDSKKSKKKKKKKKDKKE